jgi:rRNA small subunit pseudouridine methyltransferase Nep1
LEGVLKGFRVVVMSERGERREIKLEGCAVCIGAFPHGDFGEKTMNVFRNVDAEFISVADRPVTALYTTCWVLGHV